MTVGELIEKLLEHNQNAPVLTCNGVGGMDPVSELWVDNQGNVHIWD